MKRLARLEDISGAARLPAYRPSAFGTGIVHLGIGAFHRAHQAVYTDDALAAGGGDWRIIGASLRGTAAADALNPQNGLYTLIERDGSGTRGRVIASIANVIAASQDAGALTAAMTDPATRIVSLTVTEKAYGIDRATGKADPEHASVAGDLANPRKPTGVLGLITETLRLRRAAGVAAYTVQCCDNLPENGHLLRSGVVDFASRTDPALGEWVADNVAFPSTMVDRITPAATEATLATATELTGCEDRAAIETEPFTQWVIEDRFATGRPQWEAGGAIFVSNVAPYEKMKLRMLNGTHSMLAYAGFLSGRPYVRDVMTDRNLAILVRRHLDAASKTLETLDGIDLGDYAVSLEERFANPAIAHETYQIAMDGTQKLPQRIFEPALHALGKGQDPRPYAFAVAAWMRYCLGVKENGESYALRDPREEDIGKRLRGQRDAGPICAALTDLPGLFPAPLAANEAWRTTVTGILETVLDSGMAEAVRAEAEIATA